MIDVLLVRVGFMVIVSPHGKEVVYWAESVA